MLWIRVTSIASGRLSDGRIEGSRWASIVLPVPGGPLSRLLWAPAAATISALTAWCWPRTSLRSGPAMLAALARPLVAGRLGQRVGGAAAEHAHRAAQALDDRHLEALDQPRLARPLGREHQRRQPGLERRLRDRQRALLAGSDRAVERELAEQHVALQPLARELLAGREHRAGEREVEAGADLRHVARGEVRGDPPGRGTRTPS